MSAYLQTCSLKHWLWQSKGIYTMGFLRAASGLEAFRRLGHYVHDKKITLLKSLLKSYNTRDLQTTDYNESSKAAISSLCMFMSIWPAIWNKRDCDNGSGRLFYSGLTASRRLRSCSRRRWRSRSDLSDGAGALIGGVGYRLVSGFDIDFMSSTRVGCVGFCCSATAFLLNRPEKL